VAAAAGGALVDVSWIAARLDDPGVRLVEVDVSPAAYAEGHIPGAVLWNAYADLRDAQYRTVPDSELERLLARSGITPEATVVTYGYSAPLGFWLLKAHGHDDVRMLMGSREQWKRGGGAWSTELPEAGAGTAPPARENRELLASRADVEAAIGDPSQLLLDVRAEAERRSGRTRPGRAQRADRPAPRR
jgi:thiosulfate/3-mercaptopyruvate sulfurtransferase